MALMIARRDLLLLNEHLIFSCMKTKIVCILLFFICLISLTINVFQSRVINSYETICNTKDSIINELLNSTQYEN